MNNKLMNEMFIENDRVLFYKPMGRNDNREIIKREKPKIAKLLKENYGI